MTRKRARKGTGDPKKSKKNRGGGRWQGGEWEPKGWAPSEDNGVVCPECEKVFVQTAPAQKYCDACRPEVMRRYHREYKRAQRAAALAKEKKGG